MIYLRPATGRQYGGQRVVHRSRRSAKVIRNIDDRDSLGHGQLRADLSNAAQNGRFQLIRQE
jgi:hypothetical protein